MLQLLNRSYEARFLACHTLTCAVTTQVLSRLLTQLLPADSSSATDAGRVTVLCCASGLIVTPREQTPASTHPDVLRVSLNDILFCHVDSDKPDITVWVVRNGKTQRNLTDKGEDVALNVYFYKCFDANDALALFEVYNEMSQQVKLHRSNRRLSPSPPPPSSQSSSAAASSSNANWNSGTDGVDNGVVVVRSRDREIRAAMLEELRDTLRQRNTSENNVSDGVTVKKPPLKDVSNTCNSRQRKPAKVIEARQENESPVKKKDAEDEIKDAAVDLIIPSPNVSTTSPKTPFHFRRSMSEIMKRLVTKNKHAEDILKSDLLSSVNVTTESTRNATLKKKKKAKKIATDGADFEPEPVRIPNRINNLTEPYFYVSPKTKNGVESMPLNSVVQPAWIHKQVVQDINRANVTRNVSLNRRLSFGVKKKSHHSQLAARYAKHNKKKMSAVAVVNGENDGKSDANFNRSSSTTSNGSSGSESGPESKLLRSVMKKPKQSQQNNNNNDVTNETNKKNVTFHAFATVQMLP